MKKSFVFMMVFLCITLFYGCKPKEIIVEVPKIKTEYVYKDSIKYDSIYYRDSIYVEKNDSIIYVNKIQYKYKYKYLTKTDSVIVNDTIFKPYEKIVNVEVEKPLTKAQTFFIRVGKIVSVVIVLFILAILFMTFLKKK